MDKAKSQTVPAKIPAVDTPEGPTLRSTDDMWEAFQRYLENSFLPKILVSVTNELRSY